MAHPWKQQRQKKPTARRGWWVSRTGVFSYGWGSSTEAPLHEKDLVFWHLMDSCEVQANMAAMSRKEHAAIPDPMRDVVQEEALTLAT